MSISTSKKTGSVLGAVVLIGAGVTAGVPAMADTFDAPTTLVQNSDAPENVQAVKVEGVFNYDQTVMSSHKNISDVFIKASTALCNAMPNYGGVELARVISISGENTPSFEGTLGEIAQQTEEGTMIMACACSSNIAGGGAIINAEVSGVSVASLMKMTEA